MLSLADFENVVSCTPLISIDLLIKNSKQAILLGYRVNKPAQNFWFVLGGRIFKGETLAQAFGRITQNELGINFELNQAVFSGVYQHFYDNSVIGNASTHYIVLAYELMLDFELGQLPQDQHHRYMWLPEAEVFTHELVHPYTKAYFNKDRL